MSVLTKIKHTNISLKGITVSRVVEYDKTSVTTIELTDTEGNIIELALSQYGSSIEIRGIKPPVEVIKYHLEGTVLGDEYSKLYDDLRSAEDKKRAYEEAGIECMLTITETTTFEQQ